MFLARLKYRVIDFFARIGGLKLRFKKAFRSDIAFVFSSEIYRPAIKVYEEHFTDTHQIPEIAPI
ncbi:DNA cytosine methyltransferase [Candidatus Bathyarchaeota archaeon]|nr:DNA cytosine methyltransferase [Candidatus Bathyarchaeota archaeon]